MAPLPTARGLAACLLGLVTLSACAGESPVVRVGTMGINNYFGGDITVPFGGFKESGNGRDKSMHAFDDYTELKTTWIEFDQQKREDTGSA